MSDTKTTTPTETRQALAWIARQLRWERTLAELRSEREDSDEERRAA
jgi:hypothetical protein